MLGCCVGLLGFGTVGSAVARRLLTDPALASTLQLTHIVDRRAGVKRGAFDAAVRLEADPARAGVAVAWSQRVDDLFTSDVDVIVEAVGGVDEPLAWTRAALRAGKSVVTCNKQLMAHHGPELLELAARQGRQVRFEAAVGAAMPIVRALGSGLAGDRLTRIVAILNGTTNAVFTSMEAGETMERALADARARGYAEIDPSADLDGLDARAKLTILCALAFGLRVEPDQIDARSCAGVAPRDFAEARRRGETIRQLAYAAFDRQSGELVAWVGPCPVAGDSFFAQARGARNAAIITGEFAGDIRLAGGGAGGDPTAVAVLSDLLAIARDRAAIVPAPRLARPTTIVGRMLDVECLEPEAV